MGQPLEVVHGSQFLFIRCLNVDGEVVVATGRRVLFPVDSNRERHVANIFRMLTAFGIAHLGKSPGAQHHGGDLAVVQHRLAAFPVGRGVVILDQLLRSCVIQDLVHSVGAGTVALICEGILRMGQVLAHIGIPAGGSNTDIGIPGTHGPSGSIVGIQRDGIGLFLDGSQGGEEFIRGLGQLGDAGFRKNTLVVQDAVGVARGGNAVAHAVKGPCAHEVVLCAQGFQGAKRHKVLGQLVLLHGGDPHDGPVGVADSHQRVLRIVGNQFILDFHVGIDLPEFFHITVQLFRNVRAMVSKVDFGSQVGVLAQHDLVKGRQFVFRGGKGSHTEDQAQRQDQGKQFFHGLSSSFVRLTR